MATDKRNISSKVTIFFGQGAATLMSPSMAICGTEGEC